jgi:hypothetical protein
MQIIRNGQILISKTSKNGQTIRWDSVKEPLPEETIFEKIPA